MSTTQSALTTTTKLLSASINPHFVKLLTTICLMLTYCRSSHYENYSLQILFILPGRRILPQCAHSYLNNLININRSRAAAFFLSPPIYGPVINIHHHSISSRLTAYSTKTSLRHIVLQVLWKIWSYVNLIVFKNICKS